MPRTKHKPRVPTRSEKEVTREVLGAAALLGIALKRRNVGGFTDTSGRYVGCNEAGDADWSATLPDGSGRNFQCEIKKESFDPRRVRGKERERFLMQVEKLREVNRLGGVGAWFRSGEDFLDAMRRVLTGFHVEIDDEGFCYVSDEEPNR